MSKITKKCRVLSHADALSALVGKTISDARHSQRAGRAIIETADGMSLTICKDVVQNNAGHITKYGIGYYALVPVKPKKYRASGLIKR